MLRKVRPKSADVANSVRGSRRRRDPSSQLANAYTANACTANGLHGLWVKKEEKKVKIK